VYGDWCRVVIGATSAQDGFVDPAGVSFSTRSSFNISAVLVTLILCFFYTVWW
jgi:hypothetical protein